MKAPSTPADGEMRCPSNGVQVHWGALPGTLSGVLLVSLLALGAQAAPQLILEPGLPVPGHWLLPIGIVDDSGAPLDFARDDLRLKLGAEPIEDFELLDPRSLPRVWAVLLGGRETPVVVGPLVRDALEATRTGDASGLYAIDGELVKVQRPGEDPVSEAEIKALRPGHRPSRLWDGVLEVLRELSTVDVHGKAPVRRTLLVIADGGEDLPSEHPLATCVDAATRARVAVYALILNGDEDGAARLRELARRTGGRSTVFRSGADLRRFLRMADSVRMVRIPADEAAELPVEVQVEVALAGGLRGNGLIVAPTALMGVNPVVVVLLSLAAVAVLTGGFLLWWMPRRSAGGLRIRYHDGRIVEQSLPRSGLTLGTRADSDLVIEDPRVSGHHAVIRVRGGEVILTDLRSTNGTTVNDQQVRTAQLGDGDRVLLGGAVELIYRKTSGRREPRSDD